MTPERWKRIEELAEAALEHDDNERAAFLADACGHEPDLHRQAEQFLAAFEQAATQDETRAFPGRPLGSKNNPDIPNYRLMREIGRGGMGTVYLAARSDEEFQRLVAVKLLRPAPGSETLMNRFRSERQILANLDHPNIARLLDGGTTDDGWPYLVMELIEGRRIDAYCDEHQLDVAQRIDLFRVVCGAVQYAHRNLVVHRDIKPSNILVTDDGTPKLLDFGIAKLLDPTDFQHTVEATRTGLRPMTPPYASPEQVRGEVITTTSDVYSLGVLLYKLLTGRLPLATAGLSTQQIEKLLNESTPAKPSSAVTKATLTESSQLSPETLSRQRGTQSRQLSHQLAGDLDTIILMALRKEPGRRYGSVEQFAEDLRRHLKHLPVLARRDTWAYRAGKFIDRNKVVTGITGTSLLLLTGFALAMARQATQVTRQRDRAGRERDKATKVSLFLADIISMNDPDEARGTIVEVTDMLERGEQKIRRTLADEPEVHAHLLHVLGVIYLKYGIYEKAESLLQEALESRKRLLGKAHLEVAESLHELGRLSALIGRYNRAIEYYREVLDIKSRELGPSHPNAAETMINLAFASRASGQIEPADFLSRRGLEILEGSNESSKLSIGRALTVRAMVLVVKGDYYQAETLQSRSIQLLESDTQTQSIELADANAHLGSVYFTQHQISKAETLYRQALSILDETVGHGHPSAITCLINLASGLTLRGNFDQARELFLKTLEMLKAAASPRHRNVAVALSNLATIHRQTGQLEQAKILLNQSLDIYREIKVEDGSAAWANHELGYCFLQENHYDKAESFLRKAGRIQERVSGPRNASLSTTWNSLAELFIHQGRISEASKLIDQSATASAQLAKLQPDNVRHLNNLAASELGAGDIQSLSTDSKGAHRHWNKALRHITNLPFGAELVRSRDLHCLTLFRLDQVEQARPIAEDLLSIGWANPDFLDRCRQHGLIGPEGEPKAEETGSPAS